MSIASPTKTVEAAPKATPPSSETREEKLARYSSPEFTQALTETFHRAKRQAIQADREAADKLAKKNEACSES